MFVRGKEVRAMRHRQTSSGAGQLAALAGAAALMLALTFFAHGLLLGLSALVIGPLPAAKTALSLSRKQAAASSQPAASADAIEPDAPAQAQPDASAPADTSYFVALEGDDARPADAGIILEKSGKSVDADVVVIATGGLSYPSTGSTGDGYRFAKEAGHTVTPLSPALVPFVCAEDDVKELQGLSLRNIEVTVWNGKKVLWKEFGEMLFTHFGVSGPVVLSASSYAAKIIKKTPLRMDIDLKPALSKEQLDARILRDFDEAKNKQFKNSLNHLFPAKLIPVMIKRSGIDPEKQVNEVTAEERKRLVDLTKAFSVTLTGLRGYNEAIVTQGGVNVKEVNPSTMESKKLQGLYFAGEVLDLDGVTGGFNLQIAWSTGMLAGRSV